MSVKSGHLLQFDRRTVLKLGVTSAAGFAASRSVSRAGAFGPAKSVSSETIDLVDASGRMHRVWIGTFGERDGGSWPTLFLFDGNASFPLAMAAAERQDAGPLVIVGLGYPEEGRETIVRRRYLDLTSFAPPARIPTNDPSLRFETGGRDAFLGFVADTVLPAVSDRCSIGRMTVFGHSLSGHLAVHALLADRFPASGFVAADPSVWWNDHDLMADATRHIRGAAGGADGERRSVTILVSGTKRVREGIDKASQRRIEALRAGPGGRALAARLSQDPRLAVAFRSLDEETHGSIIVPGVEAAVRGAASAS